MTQNLFALNIVTVEEPSYKKILQTAAKPVQFPLQKEDIQLIAAMKEKLEQLGGVGLAAPQVNEPKQIIAVYFLNMQPYWRVMLSLTLCIF